MSALRTLLVALVVAAGLVLVGPAPAFACSCVGGDADRFVTWADVVLAGEVTAITPPPRRATMSSTDPATYSLEVDRVFAGDAGATTEVLSAVSGASCGLENVAVGRDYVVFATYADIDGTPSEMLWASLCGGTAPATPDLLAEVEAATGPGSPPSTEPDPPQEAVAAEGNPADHEAEVRSVVPTWAWGGAAAALLGAAGVLHARRRPR